MLRRVALVRTDFSEELSASFIRVTRIGKLGRTLAVTSNRRTLRRNTKALSSSETSVLTRARRHNIPEDIIFHSHSRENLKSYVGILVSCDHPQNSIPVSRRMPEIVSVANCRCMLKGTNSVWGVRNTGPDTLTFQPVSQDCCIDCGVGTPAFSHLRSQFSITRRRSSILRCV
jgi:hypothetical protein